MVEYVIPVNSVVLIGPLLH